MNGNKEKGKEEGFFLKKRTFNSQIDATYWALFVSAHLIHSRYKVNILNKFLNIYTTVSTYGMLDTVLNIFM